MWDPGFIFKVNAQVFLKNGRLNINARCTHSDYNMRTKVILPMNSSWSSHLLTFLLISDSHEMWAFELEPFPARIILFRQSYEHGMLQRRRQKPGNIAIAFHLLLAHQSISKSKLLTGERRLVCAIIGLVVKTEPDETRYQSFSASSGDAHDNTTSLTQHIAFRSLFIR